MPDYVFVAGSLTALELQQQGIALAKEGKLENTAFMVPVAAYFEKVHVRASC